MSGISTHILDTSVGKPAAGISVQLWRGDRHIASALTDGNGRCASLLPAGESLLAGTYLLKFEVGTHFSNCFYPEVSVTFNVTDGTGHYHVPLLISPYGFTTYRGS